MANWNRFVVTVFFNKCDFKLKHHTVCSHLMLIKKKRKKKAVCCRCTAGLVGLLRLPDWLLTSQEHIEHMLWCCSKALGEAGAD